MITRQDIKKAVPHGYAQKIAVTAGVTPKSVSGYLSGKTNSKKVAAATLKILEEVKKEKEEYNTRLAAALS